MGERWLCDFIERVTQAQDNLMDHGGAVITSDEGEDPLSHVRPCAWSGFLR
jgi:hypothetical protein